MMRTQLFDDAYTPAYGLPEVISVASDIYSGDTLELCAPGNDIAMLSPLQWGDPSYALTQQHTLQQLAPQPPQQPSCELDQYTAVDARVVCAEPGLLWAVATSSRMRQHRRQFMQ